MSISVGSISCPPGDSSGFSPVFSFGCGYKNVGPLKNHIQ